ncbi:helix-turn-helix domain-containing protein [Thermosipho sp. 1074]|uniref:helix-turn-helix domain-containing protein n=1 Tax=Thermosipho sp. 1074 TaxID=1643331 RepID=UPI000987D688|nr:helix-turn-helix domain-containing protein [Thermosipho sp. 1074]OOC42156.1 hypothetical protein XO08_07670 [Thermosipho sp. 1074]
MSKNIFELLEEVGHHETIEEKIYLDALAHIAGELLVYRKQHGLTQKELAEKLGMSQAMVSKIESGLKNLSIKTLAKIAAKLNGELTLSLNLNFDNLDTDLIRYEWRATNDDEYTKKPIFTAA